MCSWRTAVGALDSGGSLQVLARDSAMSGTGGHGQEAMDWRTAQDAHGPHTLAMAQDAHGPTLAMETFPEIKRIPGTRV